MNADVCNQIHEKTFIVYALPAVESGEANNSWQEIGFTNGITTLSALKQKYTGDV